MICYEIIINSFVEKHVIQLRLFIYRASQTYFSEFSLADKRQELPDDFHQKSIVLSSLHDNSEETCDWNGGRAFI